MDRFAEMAAFIRVGSITARVRAFIDYLADYFDRKTAY